VEVGQRRRIRVLLVEDDAGDAFLVRELLAEVQAPIDLSVVSTIAEATAAVDAFDCVLLYNSTQSNKAIASYTFGSQTITAGTFTLSMPVNDASNALLRLS